MSSAPRPLLRMLGAGVIALLAVPASAGAHGLVGKADLPIPMWLFVWAAAAVLVLSFAALGILWSSPRLETQFLQVSEAGEIRNLGQPTQGIGLDLRPFLAGRWLHLGGDIDDDFDRKPGLDVFYSVTPSLRLTATFNTDFGETEVDARQINLTRFSLLFPEKRAFFLEGAGVFSFASTGPETRCTCSCP